MLVYHRTYHSEAILREGFRDGYYWFGVDQEDEPIELRGVDDGAGVRGIRSLVPRDGRRRRRHAVGVGIARRRATGGTR